MPLDFYTGIHQPSDAWHFLRAFVSVNRLRPRKSFFKAQKWIMDSGAFSEVVIYGGYRYDEQEYADQIHRWYGNGGMQCAVTQDFMCEPFVLQKTGKTVLEHQQMTLDRYDAIRAKVDRSIYLMPVLQGYHPDEYLAHLEMYGKRILPLDWVGVGSVCKRNGDIHQVQELLLTVKRGRSDLRLHGFGLKTTALSSGLVCSLLHSADSMAWSFAARKEGRNQNDWREAEIWTNRIATQPVQESMLLDMLP